MGKSRGIGEIIYKLRKEAGFTQEQLAKGICGLSDIVRIENNQLVPGHFLLDRIFGRLGKSTERLEYTLRKEVYQLYELQYLIQTEICYCRFEEAERLLAEYEERKEAEQPLHRQYIEQERAQIAWLKGEKPEEVLKILEEAILQTMPSDIDLEKQNALSAEELKLLLFRWEICRETSRQRAVSELKQILEYVEMHCTDEDVKVRVYPYAVLLLSEELDWASEYEYVAFLVNDALELLRESGKLLYMTEIIEKYVQLLDYRKSEPEKANLLKYQRETLLALEEEFDVHLENYRLFQHLNREFELDYEVIRRSRKAKRISQEELSWGICSSETLSRIESGKRSPSNKNMEKLLKRLQRERNRIDMVLTTEEFEVIELKRDLEKCMMRLDKEKGEDLLKQLTERVDVIEIKNQQYIENTKLKLKYMSGMLKGEELIQECNRVLRMTLPVELEEAFDYSLNATEINTLNMLALAYYYLGDKEHSIHIYKRVLENYANSQVKYVFHIQEWEVQIQNLLMCLEETGQFQEALDTFKLKNRTIMEIGKINGVARSLVTIASMTEQQKDKENGAIRFAQALDMLHLTKRESVFKFVKDHMQNPEFFLNTTTQNEYA